MSEMDEIYRRAAAQIKRERDLGLLEPKCLNKSQPTIGGFAPNICQLPSGHAGAHSDCAGSNPMMWIHPGEGAPIGFCVDDGSRLGPEHWTGVAIVPIQEAKPAPKPMPADDWEASVTFNGKTIPIRLVAGFDSVAKKIDLVTTCRDCSAPATTERGYCVYCSNRVGWGQSYFSESEIGYAMQIHKHRENDQEARARMLAADERERPKSSATSREMAKAHPWHSDENEP